MAAPLGAAAVLASGLLLGTAVGRQGDGADAQRFPAPARVAVPARWSPDAARERTTPTPTRRVRRPARPVRVLIPAIGVRAAIVRLGLNPDRTLQTPTDFATAGWWSGGPRPGERGAAVVVGHVDSKTGPGAFYALRELRRGDGIRIVGADGRVVRFVVRRLVRFPKAHFPTRRVYKATRRPVLRLITCSGSFDTATGHYLDNTIVFARLASAA